MDIETEDDARPAQPRRDISKEMNQSYIDYGYSVVKSRAVPDVRDGLKPVHRRIVYAMEMGDYHASKGHKKSARVVGDVMGKFHPHGDSAIYDALVRLAQPFVQRYVLIDGQGNFGSIGGDPPAAMRYTESRMAKLAHELTQDIENDTVDFQPNYDGKEQEPTVLPARFPNVIVNGQTGIAVGMSTNIPPHNLREVMTACLTMLDRPEMTLDEVLAIIPGPDFPTRGVILGKAGIREAYATGRGGITMSGVSVIEEMKAGRQRIVITEVPYLVNPENIIVKVKELVEMEKNPLVGISDLRDETNREGIRIVVELKRDADANVVLNRLKKDTELVKKWHYNATCLDSKGRPREMPMLDILREFVNFRREVVERRTIYLLNNARDDLHKQIALYAATSMVDEVVKTIRSSSDADEARSRLMAMQFPTQGDFAQLLREADPDVEPTDTFKLDELQANAILSLTLRTLTGLEREKISAKAREISSTIRGYVEILNDTMVLDAVVRREMEELRAKYADDRLTVIEASEHDEVLDDDLIERKDIVINITAAGYVKRTDISEYREQRRGGKGKSGMETKDDDYVVRTLVCTTRTPLIFFTGRGMGHAITAWRLPDAPANHRGRPLVNFIPLKEDETIATVVALPESKEELSSLNLVFVTDYGTIRRNEATDFANVNKSGKIGIRLEDDNGNLMGKLMSVLLLKPEDDVLIATEHGQGIRFPANTLRVFTGRTSDGVKAIDLALGDKVISGSILNHFDCTPAEREAFALGGTSKTVEKDKETGAENVTVFTLPTARLAEMQAAEQLLLTVTGSGHGKRSSSFEYRTTERGGKGIAASVVNDTTGALVACFPVKESDGLILVTNGGQTIRTSAAEISVMRRDTRGVRVFKLSSGQKIVSVARVESEES